MTESILPPNATPAERALEQAMVGDKLPAPMRDLWNPDTCPADLLPWLAWALSIDAWKSYWPTHVKRARIRSAIDIQRRKGTADSVRKVVESFGGNVVIREWFETGGDPYTFKLILTASGEGGQEASAQFVDDIIAEVERTKPVRAHFTFTQGVNAVARIGVAAVARVAVHRRIYLQAPA